MHRFNIYSWTLTIIYFVVVTTMEYFSYKISMESLFLTLPLISILIFWSEGTTSVIQKPESYLTKTEEFKRDLFLVGYSFISGYLLSLLFQYDNSDTRGWWPLTIYFITAVGSLFACIFSLIAMMLNYHKKYTLACSFVLILSLMFVSFMMHLNPLSVFAKYETFYIILLFLIGLHLLLCLGYKVIYRTFTTR